MILKIKIDRSAIKDFIRIFSHMAGHTDQEDVQGLMHRHHLRSCITKLIVKFDSEKKKVTMRFTIGEYYSLLQIFEVSRYNMIEAPLENLLMQQLFNALDKETHIYKIHHLINT